MSDSISIKISPKGPELSRIVAGVWKWGKWGWNLNYQEILGIIEKSLELGITTFDHADIYGDFLDEIKFGKALKLRPSLRENMQLVTKCGIRMVSQNRPKNRIKSYDTSKSYIISSVENSLKALCTDRLELLLIHRPSPLMDPDELAETFQLLRSSGKVLFFGVSNFTPSQFEMINSRFPLVTNQVQASILHLDPFLDGTFDQCLNHGFSPMAWSPLASGKVFRPNGNDLAVTRVRETANQLSEKYNSGLDQILLNWLLKHPAKILPVLGTAKPERLKAAVDAMVIDMTREEWFGLWQASIGAEVP